MKLKFMDKAAPIQVMWPVLIEVPADGGEVTKEKASVRFEIIAAAEAQKLLNPSTADIISDLVEGGESDATVDFLKRVVVGWNEADFGGPFSADGLVNLATYPFARNALVRAYGDAAQGRKAKN